MSSHPARLFVYQPVRNCPPLPTVSLHMIVGSIDVLMFFVDGPTKKHMVGIHEMRCDCPSTYLCFVRAFICLSFLFLELII